MVIGLNVAEVNDRCSLALVQTWREKKSCAHLESSLPLDGDKDDSLLSVRFGVIDGEIRATHDADNDLSVE